jgi:hypothetical protein
MTDKERFQSINVVAQALINLKDRLPAGEQGFSQCSCTEDGHCAHHAAVSDDLADAVKLCQRIARQLQYPNGSGDRAQF